MRRTTYFRVVVVRTQDPGSRKGGLILFVVLSLGCLNEYLGRGNRKLPELIAFVQ